MTNFIVRLLDKDCYFHILTHNLNIAFRLIISLCLESNLHEHE